jgi:phage gp36-like protein
MGWELTPATSPEESAAGKYVTQEYMQQVRGDVNIQVWSNKGDETQDADIPAIQAAIDDAEIEIDDLLAVRYVMPLIPTPYSPNDVKRLRRLTEPVASYNLYKQRGIIEDDPIGGALKQARDEAIKEVIDKYALVGSVYKLDATQLEAASSTYNTRAQVAGAVCDVRPWEPPL